MFRSAATSRRKRLMATVQSTPATASNDFCAMSRWLRAGPVALPPAYQRKTAGAGKWPDLQVGGSIIRTFGGSQRCGWLAGGAVEDELFHELTVLSQRGALVVSLLRSWYRSPRGRRRNPGGSVKSRSSRPVSVSTCCQNCAAASSPSPLMPRRADRVVCFVEKQ
jgi:hypothetical protein